MANTDFYPTYEALKQLIKLLFASKYLLFLPYLWGIETELCEAGSLFRRKNFYPTYEALKLQSADRALNVLRHFYPTYEALKPTTIDTRKAKQNRFLPYLWGIETCTVRLHFFCWNSFLPYLWGIETKFWIADLLN